MEEVCSAVWKQTRWKNVTWLPEFFLSKQRSMLEVLKWITNTHAVQILHHFSPLWFLFTLDFYWPPCDYFCPCPGVLLCCDLSSFFLKLCEALHDSRKGVTNELKMFRRTSTIVFKPIFFSFFIAFFLCNVQALTTTTILQKTNTIIKIIPHCYYDVSTNRFTWASV